MSRVWVVDDDLLTREIIENILRLQGISLDVHFAEMRDFMIWSKEDIIFFCLDIKQGNQFIFLMEHPHPNYILMTQYESFDYAQWAVRHKARDILLKPLNPTEVKAAVESCLFSFTGDTIIDNILMELHRFYGQKIQLQEMAQRYFMRNSNFARLFKKKTGMTFKEYLWNIRLEKSAELLIKGELSIGEVIEIVCGEEPACFYRQFRKKFGMSPKQYQAMFYPMIDKK